MGSTLGIMTAITVRLIPAPEARRSMMAIFDRWEGAARTITGIIANKVIPATMEIMDNVSIRTVGASKLGETGRPPAGKGVMRRESF